MARTLTIAIGSDIHPGSAEALAADIPAQLEAARAKVLICDVRDAATEIATVDALARLALVVRRQGVCLRLSGASAELRDLIALAGLAETLPAGG